MFESLIESLPRRRRSAGASAGSVVVHSVVVLAAVLWTAGAPAPEPQPPYVDTSVVHLSRPAAPRVPIAPGPTLPGGPPVVPELPDLGLPGPLPTLDSTPDWRPATDSVASTRQDDPGMLGPIAADVADEPPELLTAASPRYPEPMRMVGDGTGSGGGRRGHYRAAGTRVPARGQLDPPGV